MGFSLCARLLQQRPVQCKARTTLFAAHYSLDRGDAIAAGCKLREAMREFLSAECQYWTCLPTKKRELTPMGLLKALRTAGHCEPFCFELIEELVQIGNKLAHLEFVRRGEIESALEFAHSILDGSPYLVEALREGGAR